jgi:hypothetical protein
VGYDHHLTLRLADAGSRPWQLFELWAVVIRSGDLRYLAVSGTKTSSVYRPATPPLTYKTWTSVHGPGFKPLVAKVRRPRVGTQVSVDDLAKRFPDFAAMREQVKMSTAEREKERPKPLAKLSVFVETDAGMTGIGVPPTALGSGDIVDVTAQGWEDSLRRNVGTAFLTRQRCFAAIDSLAASWRPARPRRSRRASRPRTR